jgi:hypothetical protein
MKHKLHLLFLTALVVLMLAGCESSTTPPTPPVVPITPSIRTLFAVSEGSGSSNSSLSAILFRHDSTGYDTDIHSVISGMGEGNDILLNGNRVIVLDNGANSIHIVYADSLTELVSIPMGMDGPNKMALIGTNLLLVTRRGQTSAAIIDLTQNKIVDTIGIGEPSIAVAVLDNKAFITGGIYNGTDHLHVIDLNSRKEIASSLLLSGAERAVADSASGQIVLVSDGVYPPVVAPRIYWVNATSNTIVDSASAINENALITLTTGGRVSLIENGALRALDNVNHAIGAPILSTSTSYYEGLYDSTSNAYYLGNAGAFSSNGTIDAYNASTGALLWSRTAGIAPAHFAFYH